MTMVMAKILFRKIIGSTSSIMRMEYNLIKFAGDVNDIRNIGKVSKKSLKISLVYVSMWRFIIAHHSFFLFQWTMYTYFFIQNQNTHEFCTILRYFYRDVWKYFCSCMIWFNICPNFIFSGVSSRKKMFLSSLEKLWAIEMISAASNAWRCPPPK